MQRGQQSLLDSLIYVTMLRFLNINFMAEVPSAQPERKPFIQEVIQEKALPKVAAEAYNSLVKTFWT